MSADRMSEGFVDRPPPRPPSSGMTARLAATAANGKAVAMPSPGHAGYYRGALAMRGLKLHTQKQPDGTALAWCDRDGEASMKDEISDEQLAEIAREAWMKAGMGESQWLAVARAVRETLTPPPAKPEA